MVASLVQAAPEASFQRLTPANGATVRSAKVMLSGRVDHDVYAAPLIRASLNGKPVPLDRGGRFSVEVPLKPGANTLKLQAAAPNPRQQTTMISAFIDGSMVYGSDETFAKSLRTLQGGRMKTSGDNLLPLDADGLFFLAGDVRANENLELLAIHTLFLREHNQLADAIAKAHPELDDEAIYQQARRIVAAELQVITYQEFLPALLGPGALRPYRGHDPAVNPGIATEFSTAAFRIGHTMVGGDIGFLDNDGNDIREEVDLADAFFNPAPIKETGPDPLLKYLASDNAQEVDTQIITALRDFLFGPPGTGGLDLASLNIERGRDHGIADFNTVRKAYGLPAVRDFQQITRDVSLAEKLRSLYGTPDPLDLWIGGLAEDHVPGSSVGPTFRRIIADQFERARDGDSHWHEREFFGKQLATLRSTRLSDIIRRNTSITKLQDNVFVFDPVNTLAGLTGRPGKLPADLILGPPAEPASYDGSGNHPLHPLWGSAGSPLLRFSPAAYADGISESSGADRPGARLVSNTVCTQTTTAPNNRMMSAWIYGWGQFIDHDLSITFTGTESLTIPVPAGDPSFDPQNTGTAVIPTTRSTYDASTGTAAATVNTKTLRITFKPAR